MSQFLFRLGRGCARHPFRTLGGWLLVAAVVLSLASGLGGDYVNDYTVPGVESQEATDALQERFPSRAGESGRVVFHVEGPRLLRTSAVWSADDDRVIFYDSTGTRFREVKLSEGPTLG